MKLFTIVWVLIMPICVQAQTHENSKGKTGQGVKFEVGLNWEQIKAKAKQEKKFIFIDCFTTWCGPCKMMDENVFSNDTVGDFMNNHFVSLKMQMDETVNDNQYIKSWHQSAKQFEQKYKVSVFPTYLFFDPNGKIVHRATSYNKVNDFIAIADRAMSSDGQYYTLLEHYKSGKKDYSVLPYLIDVTKKIGDEKLEKNLTDDYLSYLKKLPLKELYTKERITTIASTVNRTSSKFLKLFYPDGTKVNKIMQDGDYAWRTVNTVITKELFGSVIEMNREGKEPNWEQLYCLVNKRFGPRHADAVILWRKSRWHENDPDKHIHAKIFSDLVERNGLDSGYVDHDATINGISYVEFFEKSDDTVQIKKAIKWMESVVRRSKNLKKEEWDEKAKASYQAMVTDTYACLLYKVGRVNEGIEMEQNALDIANKFNLKGDAKEFSDKIDKMKNRQIFW